MMVDNDVFKTVFKKLKSRNPPPDYNEVLDFTDPCSLRHVNPCIVAEDHTCRVCDDLGLNQHYIWKVFDVKQVPGLKFILNPFTSAGQRFWIRQCIEKYPAYPNVTNLGEAQTPDLWESYCKNYKTEKTDFWKMRWATLGYHHNWNSKVYSEDHHSPFPDCLSELSKHTALALGMNINPQAAIINYYHLDSTLSGHTDHSEFDRSAPLLSFSFGRKAVFMIGGQDKCTYPLSMYVRNGDVIIMSGESRLCYHAVPKIFSKGIEESNIWNEETDTEEYQEAYNTYLRESRINMNVRQVF